MNDVEIQQVNWLCNQNNKYLINMQPKQGVKA